MKQFYSYLWLREDGTPYYVGKGCGNRAYDKRHKVHPPKDRSKILIFPMRSEIEAFESETALIDMFGRIDIGSGWAEIAPCLRNMTDGGDGHSGYVPTAEHREKIRKSSAGNTNMLGHKHSEEARLKMRLANLGKPKSAEAKEKMRIAKLGKKQSPEHVANNQAAQKHIGIPHTDADKEKMRQAWVRRKENNFLKSVAWG